MSNLFARYRDKVIPILNWNFFRTLNDGVRTFNKETWSGWKEEWQPIAANELGDVIVLIGNGLYEIQHGTGRHPKPKLITDNLLQMENLFQELSNYKGFSEEEPLEELRNKKEYLTNLRKNAPRPLKSDFTIEIDDIKEAINDLRFNNSKEGKFLNVAREIQKTALAELRVNDRYSEIRLLRREKKLAFYITGKLNSGESLEEIKSVFSKYSFSFPVEYELTKNA
ncbi:MAG: hypothetical protein OEY89_13150 [Gammaproteobacteria bacterium]|nr:hypothetical protein [Gammaproteobacteria bacterium]